MVVRPTNRSRGGGGAALGTGPKARNEQEAVLNTKASVPFLTHIILWLR